MHRWGVNILSMFLCLLPALGKAGVVESYWNPVPSEHLLSLPAKDLDKVVEQHFRRSSLFLHLEDLNSALNRQTERLQSLDQRTEAASESDSIALQHQLLDAKSHYLDLLQEHQTFRGQALIVRKQLYEQLLEKLQWRDRQSSYQSRTPKDLLEWEKEGWEVDEGRLAPTLGKQSAYSTEHVANLTKINALKTAISKRLTSQVPVLEESGKTVSREGYIHHILIRIESEYSLLEQERLMLRYMARLVALGAQALEHELIQTEVVSDVDETKTGGQVSVIVDLFVD